MRQALGKPVVVAVVGPFGAVSNRQAEKGPMGEVPCMALPNI